MQKTGILLLFLCGQIMAGEVLLRARGTYQDPEAAIASSSAAKGVNRPYQVDKVNQFLVLTFDQKIQILDASDRDQPRLVTTISSPGTFFTFFVGDILYTPAEEAGAYQVYDLSQGATPRVLGQVALPKVRYSYGSGSNVLLENWVMVKIQSLVLADFTNPLQPILRKERFTDSQYQGRRHGDYYYTSTYTDFAGEPQPIAVYDLSDPDNITLTYREYTQGNDPYKVTIFDNKLYVNTNNGAQLEIYDLSNPATPAFDRVVILDAPTQGLQKTTPFSDLIWVEQRFDLAAYSLPLDPKPVTCARLETDTYLGDVLFDERGFYLIDRQASSLTIYDAGPNVVDLIQGAPLWLDPAAGYLCGINAPTILDFVQVQNGTCTF